MRVVDTKKLLRFVFLWLFIFSIGMFVHELSHMFACQVIGGQPSLSQVFPHFATQCKGILSRSGFLVLPLGYFFMLVFPYIIHLVILSSILSLQKKPNLFSYTLTIFIVMDIAINYFFSIIKISDFKLIAMMSILSNNIIYSFAGLIITLAGLYFGISYLLRYSADFVKEFQLTQ